MRARRTPPRPCGLRCCEQSVRAPSIIRPLLLLRTPRTDDAAAAAEADARPLTVCLAVCFFLFGAISPLRALRVASGLLVLGTSGDLLIPQRWPLGLPRILTVVGAADAGARARERPGERECGVV